MKDLVSDIITSYEHRIVAVESLITNAYETAVDSDDGISQPYETGQKLRDDLRENLVRNCSLRRKDFDNLTSKIFADIDLKKTEIESERRLVKERLRAYLRRQQELVASLKQQLAKSGQEDYSRDNLEAILNNIRTSQKEAGEKTFALLRDFQFRLKIFRQELEGLNDKLQRILERGEILKLEDLRQLQAGLAYERRKTEREVRKSDVERLDVERLLVRFSNDRQKSIHHGHQIGA